MDANTEVLIGLGLFAASELIGLSKLKSNSILQLVLGTAMQAFPYELKRRGTTARATTTRRRTTTTRKAQ